MARLSGRTSVSSQLHLRAGGVVRSRRIHAIWICRQSENAKSRGKACRDHTKKRVNWYSG
jgi:hypothetical protein